MYRILVNTCHDLGRSRRRRAETAAADPAPSAAADIPLKVALERSLGLLSDRQRSVFLMFEAEGFRHAEIAAVLEIPEATSRTILFEARRELQRMLRRD